MYVWGCCESGRWWGSGKYVAVCSRTRGWVTIQLTAARRNGLPTEAASLVSYLASHDSHSITGECLLVVINITSQLSRSNGKHIYSCHRTFFSRWYVNRFHVMTTLSLLTWPDSSDSSVNQSSRWIHTKSDPLHLMELFQGWPRVFNWRTIYASTCPHVFQIPATT